MYTSPFADVALPTGSVYDEIFGTLTAGEADKVAIVDTATGTSLTYAELQSRVDAFAGGLAARGIGVGDVVALHCVNSAAFVIAFHGILRSGATATTVNALYSPGEIASQMADSGASAYITLSMLTPTAIPACEQAGITTVIVLDGAEDYASLDDLLGEAHAAPEVRIDPDSLAVLPYSSGTTGKAKGVMLTHRMLVANIAQCTPSLRIDGDSTVIAILPFFHIYGMNVIMNLSLRHRAQVVTMPKFDLEQFLTAIEKHQASYLFIAPPIAVALAKHPLVDSFDTSSVEVIVCGAAPMDEALGRALTTRIPAHLLQGFGMTELSPVSHVTPWDDADMPVGSIGLPIPNVEFKVVDVETGKEVDEVPGGRTAPGEMWVRSPGVMKGYLGNDAATAETVDADGFLHTGDIVEVGPKGEVYVVDRLKELIKYKGYQVPPAELEAILLTHPAVGDSAVVPYPDEDAGEIPRAFVVLQDGATATSEELMAYVAAKVAPHKRIRLLEFIDAIPKSAAGKILRKDLKVLPLA